VPLTAGPATITLMNVPRPKGAGEAVAMVPPDHFTRLYTLTVTQP